ncbi:sensor histidine kinase [Sphingobacterium shayense]|uniref:sensor histidine kinase n=1 Tax=Sphingobacterium shayense TaxID=626343 RepID=UPI001C12F5ED|nr:histidine kinase [Sphingobacterium shayense]
MPYLIYWIIGFALLGLLILLFWMYSRLRLLQRQNKNLILAKREFKTNPMSEEDVVRYKLDPHLLKNALNTIQSHAYQSYYALDKLSNVLDFILYESDLKWVKLKDEIAFAQNLIEINRLKVSPLFDLHVRVRIPQEAEELLIPRFISINPIENAFKHADLQQDDSFISVVYEVKDDTFVLIVTNKISELSPIKSSNGGVGNKTFLARLENIYGDNYKLDIEQKDSIYSIKLELQLTPYDQMHNR